MNKKQGMQGFRPKLISLAVASCFVTSSVLANPTNPVVKHGAANFTNPAANVLHVTTATPQTIINWGSFSINANELTKFLQPSVSSAVLNRVVGGDPSAILGALQSNGRVLLVNPSGIIFGAGAQIDVAGLVATSLNLSNADFLANRMNFAEMPGAGSIVNNGNITTPQGGSVYLVGPAVTNNGIIASPKGEVVLAAGNSVELVNPGTPNLRVEISAAENEARNIGQIISESGRVGIYAGLINNSGTVRANSAVAQGGKILLQAKKSVTLESTSILDASGAGGGRIDVLAKNGGTVNVNGRLDASAPVSGDGGFIETSADTVKVANGTRVTTAAATGKTGVWLVDPNDYTIGYGGDITGAQLGTNLGTTNVTLTSDMGSNVEGSGNILVNEAVSWNSPNSLTLIAREDIFQSQSITNAGSGGINLYAGWNGASTTTPVVTSITGDIMLMAPISTLGNVLLIAGGHAEQVSSYGGKVTANGLRIDSLGAGANFERNANSVNTLSGQSAGSFLFTNSKTFSVGTTGGLSGIAVNSTGSATVNLGFSGTTGATNLNVNNDITAIAGGSGGASIQLTGNSSYGGNINISNAKLTATGDGGEGGSGFIGAAAYGGAVNIANSTLTANTAGTAPFGFFATTGVNIFAGTTATISTSTVQGLGGSSAAYGGQMGTVSVNGNSGVTITGSTLRGQGGNGVDGAQGSVGVNSNSGTLTIQGGSVIEALGGTGSTGQGGRANVNINSNSVATININNSTVRAKAGSGSSKGESFVGIFDGTGNVNITNGSKIEADGAEGQIHVGAGGTATISNSAFTAKGNSTFGESFVDVEASTISVSNSSFTVNHATNTPNEPGTSEASVYMYANGSGGLNISGSTIDISATGTAPGYAFAELSSGEAGGSVAISNSTIKANGLGGAIFIGSEGGSVSVTNSAVAATGKTGASGDVGVVAIVAENGSVNTSGSAISAIGATLEDCACEQSIQAEEGPPVPFFSGTSVTVVASGDITLGSLTSSEVVLAISENGRIIDGNTTGSNAQAPLVGLLGYNGVGSLADPLETVTSELAVVAYGGEIGVLNAGNLVLSQLMNSGSGASAVGTTGTMLFATPISVSGSLNLVANNGMVVEPGMVISSGGDLLLDSGMGDMGFNGAQVTGNNVTLNGNNIFVGFDTSTAPTFVGASNLMKVTTLGNLNVLGGASPTASAELHGGVDVNLTVGQLAGFVNVVTGSAGASAKISAGSSDTINLHFPTLGTGGYFVNGSEGTITSGDTGFFVNGLPAVLNENFFVTYGVTELPPDVQLAINQTVASTNQQSQLGTDIGNETGSIGGPEDEKEKKQLPICSR